MDAAVDSNATKICSTQSYTKGMLHLYRKTFSIFSEYNISSGKSMSILQNSCTVTQIRAAVWIQCSYEKQNNSNGEQTTKWTNCQSEFLYYSCLFWSWKSLYNPERVCILVFITTEVWTHRILQSMTMQTLMVIRT